jgi:tetratricopeptide (TPR) repeat protein
MKLTVSAFAFILAGTAAPALAQYEQPAPQSMPQPQTDTQPQSGPKKAAIKPSPQALKAIVELQDAVKAGDPAVIAEKVEAAQKVAKTKEDRFLIAQFQLQAAVKAKNNAAALSALDAIATTGGLEPATLVKDYTIVGAALRSDKKFDLAAGAFDKALAIDPRNIEALKQYGELRVDQGRKADAVAAFQRVIQTMLAGGQKPEENVYRRALGVAYEASLPVSVDLARQWVGAYPSTESWQKSVLIYRAMMKPDVEGTLDLLRLLRAANALAPQDYGLYATAAADQSNFVEAQSVLDQGLSSKQISVSDSLIKETLEGLKAMRKPTVADLEAATKMAQSPIALVRVGDRYFGLGEYAKAAEVYRQALGKPGVDSAIANLHLGMALARVGDKAGATAAFNAVTGPRAEVAKFWLVYLKSRA